MASTPVGSNALILEVLNRHNYKNWRSRLKTYLLAEDLWEVIIQAMTEPAKHDDEYKAWTKKNAKALYAIQNSCGSEMFPFIRETETAKSAWEALERVSKLTGHVENRAKNFKPYLPFTQFVSAGDWVKAEESVGELDLHSAVRAIDPRDGFGDIALHVAARTGHVHIVKELVTLMTLEELKMKNAKGSTALHVAAWNGQVDTVKELVLLMGEEKDSDGDTALHIAVDEGFVDTVKVLVLGMGQEDLKIKNSNGYTALHLAVFKGNVSIVKELGPLMGEVRDGVGDTALHIAVKKEQLEIVKELVLLMRREDLAIKNNEGYTALHLAVNKGNVPIVKQFVTKKEGEDDFDRYVQFTTCVIDGDWDKAKECLRQLDDPYDAITRVDPRDGWGDTALHVATNQGHAHIVKELVLLLKVRQEGSELKTAQDFTAYGSGTNLGVSEQVVMERAKYMVEQYEKMITSVLEVQDANGFTALHLAVSKGNVDIVKELVPLTRKEGLEIKDGHGNTALIIAVQKGHVDIVKELVQSMRVEGLEVKNNKGSNALHLVVMNGHMHIVKELMPFMRKEALEEKDGEGYTAIGCALDVLKDEDVMEIAKYMAENNNKVFGIDTPPLNWIPVVTAITNNSWDLCRYLYPLTPLEFLKPEHGKDGAQLIINCLRAKELDMALDLLQRCPILAISPSVGKSPPIMVLAGMHTAFLSGTQLGFWQKLIYNRMHTEHANLIFHDTCINISKQEDDRHNQMDLNHSVIRLYRQLINSLMKLLGVNRLRKMKWIHTRSLDILHCISEMVKMDNLTSEQFNIMRLSIFKAIEYGHVEFVTHMCQEYPPLLKSYKESRSIFAVAVDCRQNKIYSLIHGLDENDQRYFAKHACAHPENMLHLAGNLSPLSRFNHIRGAALQIQRELQWFKEVENIVPLEFHEIPNSNGMTPHVLFTENHKNLKVEAENSMKGTATSCTVVGALIVTIMFAASFTVPGGNNSTGAPMFLAKKLFLVFIISDTLSLVFSTTSVILFLGILTSRYAEEDFLKNLPTKMLIGLFTLFLSIATMMIAFSAALIIMLEENYSWAIIPCIFVACIPVASFIWLQFPLLIEIFMSTYRPGIFDKKVERWVKL